MDDNNNLPLEELQQQKKKELEYYLQRLEERDIEEQRFMNELKKSFL